jgi:hypothetical protein
MSKTLASPSLTARVSVALALGTAIAVVSACGASGDGPERGGVGSGSGASSSGASTGAGAGTGTSGSSSSGGSIALPDAGDTTDGGRPPRCDDAGNCSCINIGVYGRLPTYGSGGPGADTTIAFQSWLNSKSSAVVDVITTKTTFDEAFLGKYDVLVLQALEDMEGGPYWTFSPEELAALEAWVRAGGGVISLMGYGGQIAEVNPTNQLLAFSGLAYNTDDILGTCSDNCCYCAGSSVPLTGWNAAHPIAANLTAVGAFHGRSVSAGAEAEIVASASSVVYGATRQVDAGRVFMFNDEWVTYTSQWGEGATVEQSCLDMNNPCYQRGAATYYQVPQFWYNAIVWASGDRECFDIEDPTIVK